MSCRWQFLHQVNQYLHCLFRNLNDKRPSASSDSNFVFKKKSMKIKREKRKTDPMGGFGSTS